MIDSVKLANELTNNTVVGEWSAPMDMALGRVRFSENAFTALPMREFILFGCLRQFQSISTLRETIQKLFHFNEQATQPPVAKSTLSDAYSSEARRDILFQAAGQLITHAQTILPDKLTDIEGLNGRAVIATDSTYQKESSHYYPVTPSDGGTDNKKGHQYLTHYDMRTGIPLLSLVETESIAEIHLLKERKFPESCMNIKSAIHVMDRAYIDCAYWDKKKEKLKSTLITRMKSNLKYTVAEQREISAGEMNKGVVSDSAISLESSKKSWRLIEFISPDGEAYQYLTNDFTLEPGVVAFLYYRRWDVEKYFDNYKNDMANAKAWGKSKIALEQQNLLATITLILTKLFIDKQMSNLGMTDGDTTQKRKHAKKLNDYICHDIGVSYRVFYTALSKITRQIWRFIKNCFLKKSSPGLYQRQLRPLIERYL